MAIALAGGGYLLTTHEHLANTQRQLAATRSEPTMNTRYPNARAACARMTEALKKCEREIAAAKKDGRASEWVGRRRRELLAEAREALAKEADAAKVGWIQHRVENNARRPQNRDWAERTYTATAAAQDIANLKTAADVLRYYRQNAGWVSPAARLELDRLCRNKIAGGDFAQGDLVEFEQARRDFLTPEEAAYEQEEVNLAQLGSILDTMQQWAQIGLKELEQGDATTQDIAWLFDQYLEGNQGKTGAAYNPVTGETITFEHSRPIDMPYTPGNAPQV